MSLQQTFGNLRTQLAKRIIGQDKLVDRLLIALLADGHLLVEGAPGLAKTTAVKALADHLETHLDLDGLLTSAEPVKAAELSATG